MPKIYPFKPFIPSSLDYAKQVACLPYDVFTHKEAQAVVKGNPKSILSVTRADVFFEEKECHEQKVYDKAKQQLEEMLKKDILKQENKDCLYVYSQTWKGKTQTGLVCLSDLQDYESDIIKKHEKTRPDKEQDRTTHMEVLSAQTGNVFLAYKPISAIKSILQRIVNEEETVFVVQSGTEDAVMHKVWRIDKEKEITALQSLFEQEVPFTYIADGHHRAASAYRVYQKDKAKHKFLTTIFSSDEIDILPYNRVVKNIHQHSKAIILEKLAEKYEVVKEPNFEGLGMFLAGEWYSLSRKKQIFKSTLASLEATYVQDEILQPLFGVQDPRADHHIAFIGGIHGRARLEQLINDNVYDVAFCLSPVTMAQLFAVADDNQTMPPKSTWFEPKLLDGFFINPY